MSSEDRRAYWRVRDMLKAIADIRKMLEGKSFESMYSDTTIRAAFERHLQVLSEASAKVPEAWKVEADPTIPWSRIKGLGNQLRHAYHKLDHEILWSVYEDELDVLQVALERMLDKHSDN